MDKQKNIKLKLSPNNQIADDQNKVKKKLLMKNKSKNQYYIYIFLLRLNRKYRVMNN